MPLVIDVGPGKLIIVILFVIGGIAERGQGLFCATVIAFGDISVGQSDGYRVIRRPHVFGFGVITLGQVKIMSADEDVGGLDQVIGSNRLGFTDARFSKSQRDLLLGIFKFAFVHKELGEFQAHVYAVSIRSFESMGKAFHGGIALAQGQKRVTGSNQDG